MNLNECEKQARKAGWDNMTFDMQAEPSKPFKKCTWLDAFMGLFTVEGVAGFVMVNDMNESFPNAVCENLEAPQ